MFVFKRVYIKVCNSKFTCKSNLRESDTHTCSKTKDVFVCFLKFSEYAQ